MRLCTLHKLNNLPSLLSEPPLPLRGRCQWSRLPHYEDWALSISSLAPTSVNLETNTWQDRTFQMASPKCTTPVPGVNLTKQNLQDRVRVKLTDLKADGSSMCLPTVPGAGKTANLKYLQQDIVTFVMEA